MKKAELIRALEDSRKELLAALEGIPEDSYLAEGFFAEWSLKDLITSLLMWEAETIKLLFQVRQGMPPSTVHFSSTPEDERTRAWRAQNKGRPLERLMADFYAIRGQTIMRLNEFTDQEMNDPARFTWLRGKTLSELVADSVLNRERELRELIREWRSRQPE